MGSPSQQGRVGKPSVPWDRGDVKQLLQTTPAWDKSSLKRGAAGPHSQCLRAGFLQRGARRSCCPPWDRSPQPAKARPHWRAAQKVSQGTGPRAGAAMGAAKSSEQRGCCVSPPLPASRSWHRCAGGRGSAPGLAGWSCPRGLRHSHTAALGASSRPASPPGSVGRVRGGERSLTGWDREYAPLGVTPLGPTPQPPQHGKAAAALRTPWPSPEDQTVTFSCLFYVCPTFMLTAFTSLQGGQPHPWPSSALPCFSHCHSAPKPTEIFDN